jgi:hypothetical protein
MSDLQFIIYSSQPIHPSIIYPQAGPSIPFHASIPHRPSHDPGEEPPTFLSAHRQHLSHPAPTQQNYIPLKKLASRIPFLLSSLIAFVTSSLLFRLSVADALGLVRSMDCLWMGTEGVVWAAMAACLRSSFLRFFADRAARREGCVSWSSGARRDGDRNTNE